MTYDDEINLTFLWQLHFDRHVFGNCDFLAFFIEIFLCNAPLF